MCVQVCCGLQNGSFAKLSKSLKCVLNYVREWQMGHDRG